jgi:hypothetical protein
MTVVTTYPIIVIIKQLIIGSGMQLLCLVMSLSLIRDDDDDDDDGDGMSWATDCISIIFEFRNISLTTRGIMGIIMLFDDENDDDNNNGGIWKVSL